MTDDEASIVRLCKQLIADQIDLVAASRELAAYFWPFDNRREIQERLGLFVHIVDETDSFPLGSVRELWDPNALARKDRELAKVIALYRPGALNAAKQLLARLSPDGETIN